MGLRIRIALISLALATPVAAGVLPFDGAYGNDAGCDFYLYGQAPSRDYLLLTADTLASPKLACDFETLVTSADGHSSVEAVCSPGGRMRLQITEAAAGFSIAAPDLVLGPMPPCPSVPADPQGTVRL